MPSIIYDTFFFSTGGGSRLQGGGHANYAFIMPSNLIVEMMLIMENIMK